MSNSNIESKPEILEIEPRKIIGKCVTTTLSFDDTAALWQDFMSRHKEIKNRVDSGFYSMQVYPFGFKVEEFTRETEFERWAAVEVTDFDTVPEGMQTKTIAGGLYAVFTHVGPVKEFVETSNFIYGTWLPQSGYKLDERAHFERLGEKYYGPEHPESEEDIWLPIQLK